MERNLRILAYFASALGVVATFGSIGHWWVFGLVGVMSGIVIYIAYCLTPSKEERKKRKIENYFKNKPKTR